MKNYKLKKNIISNTLETMVLYSTEVDGVYISGSSSQDLRDATEKFNNIVKNGVTESKDKITTETIIELNA